MAGQPDRPSLSPLWHSHSSLCSWIQVEPLTNELEGAPSFAPFAKGGLLRSNAYHFPFPLFSAISASLRYLFLTLRQHPLAGNPSPTTGAPNASFGIGSPCNVFQHRRATFSSTSTTPV